MNQSLTATPSPLRAKFELVQAMLREAHRQGRTEFDDVLQFIAHYRRVDSTQDSPQSFRRISIDLSAASGVDVTHEAVRRWHRLATPEVADSEPTAAPE